MKISKQKIYDALIEGNKKYSSMRDIIVLAIGLWIKSGNIRIYKR